MLDTIRAISAKHNLINLFSHFISDFILLLAFPVSIVYDVLSSWEHVDVHVNTCQFMIPAVVPSIKSFCVFYSLVENEIKEYGNVFYFRLRYANETIPTTNSSIDV